MTFVIRDANPADIPTLLALRLSVRENRLSEPSRINAASFESYLADSSAWVAETDRGILGFAVLDQQAASIWALFVAPDAERTGVGRALHDRMIDRAQARGLSELWLNTSPGTRAEQFYAAAGWRKSGTNADGEITLRLRLG